MAAGQHDRDPMGMGYTRNRAHGDVFPDDTIEDLKRIAGQTGLKSKLPF